MRYWAYFLLIILTCAITIAAYQPVLLVIFKIEEPYFTSPLKAGSGIIYVRNDERGDGAFGAKRRGGRYHTGIDMKAPVGTPVYAAKSGIAFPGMVPTGYGKYVMIYHPDGMQTIYAHLSNWNIRAPQKVRQGDLIGFVGKSGNAAGKAIEPHLHFEIRKDGVPQDPHGILR